MHRQEVVHVGQGGLHPLGERLVVGRAEQRVQPHQAVAAPLQAGGLAGQQFRIAPVPAVGDYHHDGLPPQRPPQPLVVEGLYCLPDAGAARPVGHGTGNLGDGLVYAAVSELAGDAGKPRGE